MTKEKLTDLIKLKRLKQVEIAPVFGMSKNGFNNKLANSETRFNLRDLIVLADVTNTELAFNDKKTGKAVVTFDMTDLDNQKGVWTMIKDKIKGLITITGHSQAEIADKKGVSRQQFNLKITRNAFRINDLIELADLTNTTLAFNDNETGKPLIEFDKSDLKESKDQ